MQTRRVSHFFEGHLLAAGLGFSVCFIFVSLGKSLCRRFNFAIGFYNNVELRNVSDKPVDVSDWQLTGYGKLPSPSSAFYLPPGTVLEPDEALVLMPDEGYWPVAPSARVVLTGLSIDFGSTTILWNESLQVEDVVQLGKSAAGLATITAPAQVDAGEWSGAGALPAFQHGLLGRKGGGDSNSAADWQTESRMLGEPSRQGPFGAGYGKVPATFAPASAFMKGVWSGAVRFEGTGTNVFLNLRMASKYYNFNTNLQIADVRQSAFIALESLVASVTEGIGTVTNGIWIHLPQVAAANVDVMLTSSSRLITVPGKVIVPAGSKEMTVPVVVGDDARIQGDSIVQVSGTAAGITVVPTSFHLLDDDHPDVTLTLPSTMMENDSATATVTLDRPAESRITLSVTTTDALFVSEPTEGSNVQLTINPGSTAITFRIRARLNQVLTGPAQAAVEVQAGSGPKVRTAVTILDAYGIELRMDATQPSDGESITGILLWPGDPAKATDIQVTTTPSDMIEFPEKLTVPAGETFLPWIAKRTAGPGSTKDGNVLVTSTIAGIGSWAQTLHVPAARPAKVFVSNPTGSVDAGQRFTAVANFRSEDGQPIYDIIQPVTLALETPNGTVLASNVLQFIPPLGVQTTLLTPTADAPVAQLVARVDGIELGRSHPFVVHPAIQAVEHEVSGRPLYFAGGRIHAVSNRDGSGPTFALNRIDPTSWEVTNTYPLGLGNQETAWRYLVTPAGDAAVFHVMSSGVPSSQILVMSLPGGNIARKEALQHPDGTPVEVSGIQVVRASPWMVIANAQPTSFPQRSASTWAITAAKLLRIPTLPTTEASPGMDGCFIGFDPVEVFASVQLSANGTFVRKPLPFPGTPEMPETIRLSQSVAYAGKLYEPEGTVLDLCTAEIIGKYPNASGWPIINQSGSRIVFLSGVQGRFGTSLRIYDRNSFTLLGIASFDDSNLNVSGGFFVTDQRLVLWGNRVVELQSPLFTSSPIPVEFSTTLTPATSTPTVGKDFKWRLAITNTSQRALSDVEIQVALPRGITSTDAPLPPTYSSEPAIRVWRTPALGVGDHVEFEFTTTCTTVDTLTVSALGTSDRGAGYSQAPAVTLQVAGQTTQQHSTPVLADLWHAVWDPFRKLLYARQPHRVVSINPDTGNVQTILELSPLLQWPYPTANLFAIDATGTYLYVGLADRRQIRRIDLSGGGATVDISAGDNLRFDQIIPVGGKPGMFLARRSTESSPADATVVDLAAYDLQGPRPRTWNFDGKTPQATAFAKLPAPDEVLVTDDGDGRMTRVRVDSDGITPLASRWLSGESTSVIVTPAGHILTDRMEYDGVDLNLVRPLTFTLPRPGVLSADGKGWMSERNYRDDSFARLRNELTTMDFNTGIITDVQPLEIAMDAFYKLVPMDASRVLSLPNSELIHLNAPVQVDSTDLAVVEYPAQATLVSGEEPIEWRITITNRGPATAHHVKLIPLEIWQTNRLADGTSPQAIANFDFGSNTIRDVAIGDLPPGGSAVVVVRSPNASLGTVQDRVSVLCDEMDFFPRNNATTASVLLLPKQPDASVRQILLQPNSEIQALAYDPNAQHLYVGTSHSLFAVAPETGLPIWESPMPGPVTKVAVAADGSTVYALVRGLGKIVQVDLPTRTRREIEPSPQGQGNRIQCFDLVPSEPGTLVIGAWDDLSHNLSHDLYVRNADGSVRPD